MAWSYWDSEVVDTVALDTGFSDKETILCGGILKIDFSIDEPVDKSDDSDEDEDFDDDEDEDSDNEPADEPDDSILNEEKIKMNDKDTSKKNTMLSGNPKTGDVNIYKYIIILMLGFGLLLCVIKRKKKITYIN